MSGFFANRAPGEIGLALFLNAGDPPLSRFEELLLGLDGAGVDCLELAVPFPDSITDGPVIQRSAQRALEGGVDLKAVLDRVAMLRPRLQRLKIALFADWSHTVRPLSLEPFLDHVAGSGADGVLIHGLPPRMAAQALERAERVSLPVVTSCYATSDPAKRAEAARQASAYLYLVAAYGRTGQTPPGGFADLAPVIAALKAEGSAPVAVGFGVKTAAHLRELRAAGADAAIVGSALVARIEACLGEGSDPVAGALDLVRELRAPPDNKETA